MVETANHHLKFLRPAIGLRWRSTVFTTQTHYAECSMKDIRNKKSKFRRGLLINAEKRKYIVSGVIRNICYENKKPFFV